jgi:hypothetical protein
MTGAWRRMQLMKLNVSAFHDFLFAP